MIGYSPISVSSGARSTPSFTTLSSPSCAAGANNRLPVPTREATHVSVVGVFLSSRTCYERLVPLLFPLLLAIRSTTLF